MIRAALTGFAVVTAIAGCESVAVTPAPYARAQPQNANEIAFVKTTLDGVQSLSFEHDREYCGYVGIDDNDDFISTPPHKGRKGSCVSTVPDAPFRVLASWHTHGGYAYSFESEIPSTDDLIADIEDGVDGYIATPGGRLWYNDISARKTVLLCGPACVKMDPDYDTLDVPDIQSSYDLEALSAIHGDRPYFISDQP